MEKRGDGVRAWNDQSAGHALLPIDRRIPDAPGQGLHRLNG